MPLSEEEIKQRLDAIESKREFEKMLKFEDLDHEITSLGYDLEKAKDGYAVYSSCTGTVSQLMKGHFARRIRRLEKRIEKKERQYDEALARS